MKKVLLALAALSMVVVALAGCPATGVANSSAGTSSSTTSGH